MNKYCFPTFLFTLLLISFTSFAGPNHAGKHFFIAIPDPGAWSYAATYTGVGGGTYNKDMGFDITFSSKHTATIRLHFFNTTFGNAANKTIVINPGQVFRYKVDSQEIAAITSNQYTDIEVVRNKCLEILSDSDIIVNVVDREPYQDDGTAIIPVDNQPKATRYRICSLPINWYAAVSPAYYMAAIASACDSTVLKITPSCNTNFHLAGRPFYIVLNKGETYVLRSDNTEDLTGTLVEVVHSNMNAPLSIINLNPCMYIDPGSCCCDATMEQILPVSSWDTLVPVSMMYRQNIMHLRILSDNNNNQVYFNDTLVKTLNAGEHFDTLISQAQVIRSSHPVGVYMFMPSTMYNGSTQIGDPDMVWSMPPSRGIKESYFRFYSWLAVYAGLPSASYINTLTVISRSSNVSNIRLDNNSIANFQPFPGDTSWQFVHITFSSFDTTTIHHIESPEKIIAYAYGMYSQGGYSYNLSDLIVEPQEIKDTVYKCTGSGRELKAPAGTSLHHWSTGSTQAQIYVSDTGHYQLDAKMTIGCDERWERYDFYVADLPLPVADTTTGYSCMDASTGKLVIAAVDTNTISYTWRSGSGNVLRQRTGSTGDSLFGLPPGNYTVRLQGVNGCDTTLSLHVAGIPFPQALFEMDTVICVGQKFNITNLSGERLCTWDFGDGSPIINDSVPSYVYNSTGTYTIKMTVENSAGCDDTSDRQIAVHDFGLTLSSDKEYIDRGGTVTLTTSGTETYTILAWLPEHLFVQQHDYSQLTRVDSSVTYIAVGLSWAGCIDTAVVRVDITPEVFVPSAFSPNGDGRNDHFRLISNGAIEIEDFSVFDRWGNQVWKGYGGDGERGWDGTYKGVPMDIGVYYYIYRVNLKSGKTLTGKGDVTLIR